MSKPSLGFLKRKPQTNSKNARKTRRKIASWGIPVGVGVGFVVVLLALFGDRLLPARIVQVDTVVTLPASDSSDTSPSNPKDRQSLSFDGPLLFQASGWIEAYPQWVAATALIAGVVDEVYFLAGDDVEKGDVIAKLIDEDARLDLQTAIAKLEMAQARLAASEQAETTQKAKQGTLRHQLRAAEARLIYLEEEAQSRGNLGQRTVSELRILEARQAATSQKAIVASIQSQINQAQSEGERLSKVSQQLLAELRLAETERDRRQLFLDRTQVLSPIDGRLQDIDVVPGQQRMLGPDNPESAVIAHLYDPKNLQARIDVPLAEASKMTIGQPVLLRLNFLPDQVFRGQVIRIDGQADLQRNTLQAKVKLIDNDVRLRPEMLCRAEFLATGSPRAGKFNTTASNRVRIFAHQEAFVNVSDNQAQVWVIDESGKRLQKRTLKLGDERREAYRLVSDGLRPGDRLVLKPNTNLRAKQRVRPSDATNL